MRLFIVLAALVVTTTTTAAAQSRWTLSAGPEWSPYLGANQFIGGRVRAEYDLVTPTKPLRLRLEFGGYWEPSQTYNVSYLDGSSAGGWKQSMDLSFGLSVAVTPVPRARIAPYLSFGVLARQTWINASRFYFPAGGSPTVSSGSGTQGRMVLPVGLGLRARVGGHVFQVEMRQNGGSHASALMVGTTLPF